MELTGLKSFKNAGGSVYSSIGSSDSSKTVGYKQINNLPKFDNGTPGQQQSSTSSSTSNTSLADNYGGWGNQQFNNSVTTPAFNPGLNVPYSGKVDTSGITPNAYALTKYGTDSVKEYFNSPAATAGAKNITAPVIPTNNGGSGQKRIGSGATGGKGFNWSGVGNVITSGVQFAGDAINSFSVNETGEDLGKILPKKETIMTKETENKALKTTTEFKPPFVDEPILMKHNVRHVLTHQVIHADFYLYITKKKPPLSDDFIWVKEEDIDRYAFPRLVGMLLEVLPR